MFRPPGHFDANLVRTVLETFYEHGISEAVIVMDAQGLIRGWPPSAQELLGYTESDAIGQPISRIFTPSDLNRKIDLYELEVARKDGYAEDDRWHMRKEGHGVLTSAQAKKLRVPVPIVAVAPESVPASKSAPNFLAKVHNWIVMFA